MMIIKLALQSLLSRTLSTCILIVSLGISIFLLMSIHKIQSNAKLSFGSSISGTDLIVSGKTGESQLLMLTVFRQGVSNSTLSWKSYQYLNRHPDVKWSIPISLGDSHRGFPVMGTTLDYFKYYKYGNKQAIQLAQGRLFETDHGIVIGATIARTLDYTLGQTLYLSHGMGNSSRRTHQNHSFKIVGILKPTGTPIDNTLHISLDGFNQLHASSSVKKPTQPPITAAFIGLRSTFSIFKLKQDIGNYADEALMAIIPGVALSQLWKSFQIFESMFTLISYLVIVISFLGLLSGLFMMFNQQQSELSILRSLGARPIQLVSKLILESLIITFLAILLGTVLLVVSSLVIEPYFESRTGLILTLFSLTPHDFKLMLMMSTLGAVVSLIPAYRSYRASLNKGFSSL